MIASTHGGWRLFYYARSSRKGQSRLGVRGFQLAQPGQRGRKVKRAAHRSRKIGQVIVHSIAGGAKDAREHPVIARAVRAERDEIETVFRHRSVRHAAAVDLQLIV